MSPVTDNFEQLDLKPLEDLLIPNNHKLPMINYQSGVESSEIDPSPEAQIVRNGGHG